MVINFQAKLWGLETLTKFMKLGSLIWKHLVCLNSLRGQFLLPSQLMTKCYPYRITENRTLYLYILILVHTLNDLRIS